MLSHELSRIYESILKARSIAIIGASKVKGKIGYLVVENLLKVGLFSCTSS